jgi:hypothetical protein
MRLFVVALWLGACGGVAPYDRERLAHPTMDPRDDASMSREHVQSVHEGAIGGAITVTSGCGCD